MKSGISLFAAALLTLLMVSPRPANAAERQYQMGRVLAVEISGHGPLPKSQTKKPRTDIWWTYTFCSQDRSYIAVLRESPAKAGLTINSRIKLAATKDRIYLLNSKGFSRTLRLLRVETGKGCR